VIGGLRSHRTRISAGVESINLVSFGRHTVESRGNAFVSRCSGGIGRGLGSSPADDGGGGIIRDCVPLPHAAAVSAAQLKMERHIAPSRFIVLLEAGLIPVFQVSVPDDPPHGHRVHGRQRSHSKNACALLSTAQLAVKWSEQPTMVTEADARSALLTQAGFRVLQASQRMICDATA
jgi:hypothetical protein